MAKKAKRSPKRKAKESRPRGGASVPCPSCGETTHVLTTRRETGSVVRRRQCHSCEKIFQTREDQFPDEV